MGIREFSTFINQSFRHWKAVSYQQKVIIDGNSICYTLCKNLPWALGGEYDQFASKVEEFFKTYHFCDPIVVLDGVRCDGSKDETMRERREAGMIKMSEIQKSDSIVTSSLGPGNILPTLTLITFIATLDRLKIEYYITDGESDKDIAALADEHECPVLSNDSDFNLEHGFIHFDRY